MTVVPNWTFLIDETGEFFPQTTISRLKRDLHAAGFAGAHVFVRDVALSGSQYGAAVFTYAQAHQLIVLTLQLEFLDSHRYPPPHAGIVVVQYHSKLSRQLVVAGIRVLAGQTQQLANTVHIIEPDGVVRQVSP